MPVGHEAPQFVSNGVLSLPLVPPSPQYPFGFLLSEKVLLVAALSRVEVAPAKTISCRDSAVDTREVITARAAGDYRQAQHLAAFHAPRPHSLPVAAVTSVRERQRPLCRSKSHRCCSSGAAVYRVRHTLATKPVNEPVETTDKKHLPEAITHPAPLPVMFSAVLQEGRWLPGPA
ncbi:hypothetical protein [Streptomyces gibsoniae]|uniref:Uncharacterized protein n=1 Tax=Streptomyces gibsoniae TaxID=3075529 RepID=A0ABU2U9K2_9ACTN|nr:hypothetical protein [Streptomyces sp. DSM 41699]MDT0469711.1 hypothetical protein [Streptomyces sp. DSM 41699]